MTKIKYNIRWKTTRDMRKKISRYFGIDNLTVNHLSTCFISEEKEEKFLEGVKKGFYSILEKTE